MDINDKRVKVTGIGKIECVIRLPENFDENKKYPVFIYLHGAGYRFAAPEAILSGAQCTETEKPGKSLVSVFPICKSNSWFDIFEKLQNFAQSVSEMPFSDSERIYLCGASMGGYAAWQLAMSRPDLFAALVPICGGGMYWNTERLKNIPVRAFHGREDRTVLCEESEKMVAGVNKHGGNAKLTVFEGVAHPAWFPAFRSEELWQWLFLQKRKAPEKSSGEFNNAEKFG